MLPCSRVVLSLGLDLYPHRGRGQSCSGVPAVDSGRLLFQILGTHRAVLDVTGSRE